jgi:hypothetical protein
VAENLVRFAVRKPAVGSGNDLAIGPVDADPQGPDEHLPFRRLRLRNLTQARL